MEIMNEIDRLLAGLDSEKVESAENIQIDDLIDDHQSCDYDPEFLDTLLNEVSGGDVSISENNENASVTSVFAEDEEVAQVKLQDTTPFNHSSSVASNLLVDETDLPAETQEINVPTADPVVTITYRLAGQQMVILPTKLSQDRNIPVVVTDTLPFKLINSNSEITLATTADNIYSGEASASTITPSSSGSRKRKLYEEEEFSDPEMEKKRQNAINAKKHRNKTKETIQDLQQRLNSKEQECFELTRKLEDMARKMEKDQNAHNMESAALRNQNDELKHKLQILTFLTS